MLREKLTFSARTRQTVLGGWRVPSRRRPALPDCSVVIPASGPGRVEGLLDALLAAPDAPGEVVVVDEAPSQELGLRLRVWAGRHAAPFELVYVSSPPGLTRQRNVAIDVAGRDFIFFLDPGVEPLPGYFAATRRVFDLDRDRCVGGVAGVVVNGARSSGGRDPFLYSRCGDWSFDAPPFSGLRRVDFVPGHAGAWRREVFASRRFSCYFGSWPEGEDVEMSLRAGRQWTFLACGEARVRRVSEPAVLGYDAGHAAVRNRYFIWRRHIAQSGARRKARFWLNGILRIAANLHRPSYAAGILSGIVSCLIAPPRFTEPPARREYILATETYAAQTGN